MDEQFEGRRVEAVSTSDGVAVSRDEPVSLDVSEVAEGPQQATGRIDPGREAREARENILSRTRRRAVVAGRGVRSRLDQSTRAAQAREADVYAYTDAAESTAPIGHTVPLGLKEAAAWSWRILLVAALVYVGARALAQVPIVTIPFITSLLLAAVLTPVRRWLHVKCRIPHSLAAFIALLIGVTAIVGIFTFIVAQVRANAPRMIEGFVAFVEQASVWLRDGPLQMNDEQVAGYANEISAYLTRNQEALLSGALSTLSTLTHLIGGFLLLLLTTFFMLRDGEPIWSWTLSLLPRRSRRRLDQVGRAGWHTVGGFVRGQTVIALLHATTLFVLLWVLHVPMAVALSVLIFVASYIPILGMTVAGSFCVIVSLIEHGPGAALIVAIAILTLVQLEAHLLQPLIMAHHVEVHPLGVAIAVLAGTTLGGIAGALFAVPIVAFVNATIRATAEPLPPEPAQVPQVHDGAGRRNNGSASDAAADATASTPADAPGTQTPNA
ncbi:MAG: AI-2E family transporter [Dermatophilus congolensis]|nr:AI-2E family transporter [Dermatophilus congolensis]